MVVVSKPFASQNPKVEAQEQVQIQVEAEMKPEIEVGVEADAEEPDALTCFNKSIQELKDLRSQLHNAADFCKASFQNATHKHMVIDNTKEYLCRAIVTVVDHLGSVSASLNHQISETNYASETELRINNMKQKLLTCQQYSQKLALHKVSWNADFPRYHPRYIMLQPMPILRRSNAMLREPSDTADDTTKIIKNTKEAASLVSYSYKPLVSDSSTLTKTDSFSKLGFQVENGLAMQPKHQHQLLQFQEKRKLKRRALNWKPMEKNDLLSLVKWKRMA